MSILSRLFTRAPDSRATCRPLYETVVARGRVPDWYHAGVPDTLDGRFEMITAILAMVLLRLERDDTNAADAHAQSSVWLTELFIDDMDGQLRSIGVGDFVVGKHVGKMLSALGGRLTGYRAANGNDADLRATLLRNVWGGADPGEAADQVAALLSRFIAALAGYDPSIILTGNLPDIV